MRFGLGLFALVVLSASFCHAEPLDEVNEWRRRVGLPQFARDAEMMRFAQMKAEYRAQRGLKDGHDGPKANAGWREGTGEATAQWGWLTCVIEESATHAGAGLAIGHDGERYMVLVLRGGTGRALISRQNIPIHDTSAMTPNPVDVRVKKPTQPK